MLLSQQLNHIEVPEFEDLIKNEEALEEMASSIYNTSKVQYVYRFSAKYCYVYEVEFFVRDACRNLYIKKDRHDARISGTQLHLEFLLTGNAPLYRVAQLEKGEEGSILITERAPGKLLSWLNGSGYYPPPDKDEFYKEVGMWFEKVTILGLQDRQAEHVFWDGNKLTDIDYGCHYGKTYNNRTRADLLKRVFRLSKNQYKSDAINSGRFYMMEIIEENVIKNRDKILELNFAFNDAKLNTINGWGPLGILILYAEYFASPKLREVIHEEFGFH